MQACTYIPHSTHGSHNTYVLHSTTYHTAHIHSHCTFFTKHNAPQTHIATHSIMHTLHTAHIYAHTNDSGTMFWPIRLNHRRLETLVPASTPGQRLWSQSQTIKDEPGTGMASRSLCLLRGKEYWGTPKEHRPAPTQSQSLQASIPCPQILQASTAVPPPRPQIPEDQHPLWPDLYTPSIPNTYRPAPLDSDSCGHSPRVGRPSSCWVLPHRHRVPATPPSAGPCFADGPPCRPATDRMAVRWCCAGPGSPSVQLFFMGGRPDRPQLLRNMSS